MKYNIFELPDPLPEEYQENDIVWWRKGNETDGYWYKAECPRKKMIALGDTQEEVVASVIELIENSQIIDQAEKMAVHILRVFDILKAEDSEDVKKAQELIEQHHEVLLDYSGGPVQQALDECKISWLEEYILNNFDEMKSIDSKV